MRDAGATARLMLIQAAAQQWKRARRSECETEPAHRRSHRPANRRAGYGELASAAAKLPVPKKEAVAVQARKSIGATSARALPSMTSTRYAPGKASLRHGRQHVDGMVYASIEHPPVLGGKVKSYDDKEAAAGSRRSSDRRHRPFNPPHAFQPLGGVAVIADNTWAAFQGRKKLKIEWDNGPNASYNSAKYHEELQATSHKPGKVIRNVGDVDAEFAKGGKIIEADYYVPLLAHASMEPPVARGGLSRRQGYGCGLLPRIRRPCRAPSPTTWASPRRT